MKIEVPPVRPKSLGKTLAQPLSRPSQKLDSGVRKRPAPKAPPVAPAFPKLPVPNAPKFRESVAIARYPRDLAIRALTRVLSDNTPLDDAIAAFSGEIAPDARAWMQEVCSGTLRWKGRLDQAIDSVALKKKPTGWLRKALLVAAYQLVGQERTSPGAVVGETVTAIKKQEGEFPAKFANALLRKISDHSSRWRELPLQKGASVDEGAAWASMPDWLWKRLVSERGLEWARAYAMASLDRPVLWIRARKNDWTPHAWASPGPVAGSWRVTEGGAITAKEGFNEGEFFVQDISSQKLVNEISAAVRAALGNETLTALDLCAAPGGKSVGLAWNGFQVSASDRDAERIALLDSTIARVAHGEVRVVERAKVSALPAQDLVWVDAPCTGTGILRRHPDVRWLRRERELAQLTKLQRELVAEAWERVKPGGFLAYSVCSVLKEEGEEALAGLPAAEKTWFLTPQEEPNGDGFWASLVRKPV